jgi:hypothetical protein
MSLVVYSVQIFNVNIKSIMKSTGAPKQTMISMGYDEIQVIDEPDHVWLDGNEVKNHRHFGPYLAYSQFEYEGTVRPPQEHIFKRSTFAKIAAIRNPEDTYAIIRETGELGIRTFKVAIKSSSDPSKLERFYADRWLEWQNEVLRWSAFLIVAKLEINSKKFEFTSAIDQLKQLNEEHSLIYDVRDSSSWIQTAPGLLIGKLSTTRSLGDMKHVLANHINKLTRLAITEGHIELRLISAGSDFVWEIISTTSWGSAILSATMFLGSRSCTIGICQECGKVYERKHGRQIYCPDSGCASRASSRNHVRRLSIE